MKHAQPTAWLRAFCGVLAFFLRSAHAEPPDALLLCAGGNELSLRDAATGGKLWRWSGDTAEGLEPAGIPDLL